VLRDILQRIIDDGKRPILVLNIFRAERYHGATLADLMIRQLRSTYDLVNDGEQVSAVINHRFYSEYTDSVATRGPIYRINETVKTVGYELSVTVLNRMDYVCNSNEQSCYAIDKDYRKYFLDSDHRSLAGDRFFAGRVDAIHWLSRLNSEDAHRLGGDARRAEK
jgi:hypothetical protein